MVHYVRRERGEEMEVLVCGVKGLLSDPLLDEKPLNDI